ncbi:MAG: methyltransferase domain-containing protein [Sedimentisphaerales bacterium]|nr:methyltransferase domain-containing protein [Sedimentisphaerales bacterium]
MTGQQLKSARTIAVEVLNRCDPKHVYAASVLSRLLNETDQRQRTTDLVLGTIRNHRAIDKVITTFSGRPVDRIPVKLLNIIRVGTYELVYSPDTAQHSVVNEAVENTRAIMGKKQVGFVNAVLRQITRSIANRRIELSRSNAMRTLCQNTETGCEFDVDFLPDIESSPSDYLSTVFSLPEWLVSDWLDEFGMELTRRICFGSSRRPGIYLRANSLKTTTENLAGKFQQAAIEFEIIDNDRQSNIGSYESSMIKIKSPRSITELPGFAEGLFTVQDITASRVVGMLRPQSCWTILDLCAAPGVKTTQLAEITGDSAKIVATDIDSERLKKVEENMTRLGIKSIEVVLYDKIPTSKFDCILLDVPCSNTGVLARRVEARFRITPNAIKKLVKTQKKLLDTAASMLRPNGVICYSTCSIQKDENGNLIRDFLEENPGFVLNYEKLTLPAARQLDCDGGYTAILALKG